jgi:UDP-N-acetylglucosamine/UDP-N-acetylgalactosamine diphosphorylase
VRNNLIYIGNIRALQAWYQHVRRLFANDDCARACQEGALDQLNSAIAERIKRLEEWAEKMPRSLEIARAESRGSPPSWCAEQEQLVKAWPAMEAALKQGPADAVGAADRDRFLGEVDAVKGAGYLNAVRALGTPARRTGTAWLQAMVNDVSAIGGFNRQGDYP